jgi:hypothetical protein
MPKRNFAGRNLPRLRVAIALLSIASMPVALAERWVKIPTTAANVEFAIEMDEIERTGNVVKFREKLIFLQPEKLDPYSGKQIKEKKVVRLINCQNRTQGVKSGGVFDPKGKLIEWVMVEDNQIEWFAVPPNTVAEREMKLVCNGQ